MTTSTASGVDVVRGVRIDVQALTKRTKSGSVELDDVSRRVLPGELVAIVGGGAALRDDSLEAMVVCDRPAAGRVLLDGAHLHRTFRGAPQLRSTPTCQTR
ncbi:MAG TPA: hypothetical protein VF183_06855 [Acidimicrobiales bacterium]